MSESTRDNVYFAGCARGSRRLTLYETKEIDMKAMDYTTEFTVPQSPKTAYDAILNVRGWWSQAIEGPTDQPDVIWKYHCQDVHRCSIKTVELVAGKGWFGKSSRTISALQRTKTNGWATAWNSRLNR